MSFAASGSPTTMRTLTYAMNLSVDGYISGTPVPGAELHQWFNDQLRAAELSLYGRAMWELMSGYWPTADEQPDASPVEIDFARVWRLPRCKVIFTKRLLAVSRRRHATRRTATQMHKMRG